MSRLLLSLGHNSSAILVDGGHIVAGYEEERLSKIKSDSTFPRLAIQQLEKLHTEMFKDISDIYISHWFVDGTLPEIHDKYFDPLYFEFNIPKARIHSVSMDFTHHDAHAWSACSFIGPTFSKENTLIVVADGFGNFGETISLYWLGHHNEPKLIRRSFGYQSSLGLMYQYATAFLGLKENQDEYKLLGYEAHISDYLLDEEIEKLQRSIIHNADVHLEIINSLDTFDRYDPLLALDALPALRVHYGIHFQKVLDKLDINDVYSDDARRSIIAYYVQSRLEYSMKTIVSKYKPMNLILVGGLFMNVKLNNELSKMVNEISIMPLAGDQGAAIGLYQAMESDFIWPDHLNWGTREFYSILCDRLHMFMCDDPVEYTQFIIDLLKQDKIVNVIKGNMEFGARALGSTTTLALPSKENVEYINELNGRNTIMPMAPVVTRRSANNLFENVDRVHQSLEYMVCTRDYRTIPEECMGAVHSLPIFRLNSASNLTGRPQVIDSNHWLYPVLKVMPHEMLINTSFNEHGMPICYSMQDILRCHQYQLSNDLQNRVYTVIVT